MLILRSYIILFVHKEIFQMYFNVLKLSILNKLKFT